jgi:hypothetical protein
MTPMINLDRFRAPLLVAVAALVAASCGSTTTAPANVYITSTLGSSTSSTSTGSCNIDEPNAQFFTLGSPSLPVATGTMGAVVSCQVASNGAGAFDVNLVVNVGQEDGITIGGTLTDSPGTSQGGLSVNFNKLNSGSYSESDCTVVLSTEGNPPITAGRVWGTLTCPTIVDAEDSYTCAATATFIFQNCAE